MRDRYQTRRGRRPAQKPGAPYRRAQWQWLACTSAPAANRVSISSSILIDSKSAQAGLRIRDQGCQLARRRLRQEIERQLFRINGGIRRQAMLEAAHHDAAE